MGPKATVPAGEKPEIRTVHLGDGMLRQSDVYILVEGSNKVKTYLPAVDQANYHQDGAAVNSSDWKATATTDLPEGYNAPYLTYGPYISLNNYGAGTYVANFHLSFTNPNGRNRLIATVDIIYQNSLVTVAARKIYRSNFIKGGQMYAFPMSF